MLGGKNINGVSIPLFFSHSALAIIESRATFTRHECPSAVIIRRPVGSGLDRL